MRTGKPRKINKKRKFGLNAELPFLVETVGLEPTDTPHISGLKWPSCAFSCASVH